jgi:hypothetical protein
MGESLNLAVRKARQGRSSKVVRCAKCAKLTRTARSAVGGRALCYECRNRAAGRSIFEDHHTLGRHMDPDLTVTVPGNLHRDLSEWQLDWPEEVRDDKGKDPLLIAVTVLCAIWDWYRGLAPYFQHLIGFFRRLRAVLVVRYGARWFETLKLGGLWASPAV